MKIHVCLKRVPLYLRLASLTTYNVCTYFDYSTIGSIGRNISADVAASAATAVTKVVVVVVVLVDVLVGNTLP